MLPTGSILFFMPVIKCYVHMVFALHKTGACTVAFAFHLFSAPLMRKSSPESGNIFYRWKMDPAIVKKTVTTSSGYRFFNRKRLSLKDTVIFYLIRSNFLLTIPLSVSILMI